LGQQYLQGKASMKKSIKASLISAFVFPGAGHIYLKKYFPGLLLVGVSSLGIYYLILNMVEKALQIVEKIQLGHVQADATVINQLLSNQSTGSESQLLSIATIAIAICWIIGILDSYRIGMGQDKNQ
jgi:hypothetical protein